MATKQYQNLSTQSSGSITKMRAEQVKSEDGLGSLAIDLEALRGQVKDIIGSADYKEEITGEYAKVQIVDLAAHFDASGASKLIVKQDAEVTGAAALKSTLAVDGAATLKSTLGVVGAAALDSTLSVTGSATLKSTLGVDGATALKSTLAVDGATTLKAATAVNATLTVSGAADFNGTVTADKISIDGDTVGRLYRVGPFGEIMDEPDLTFAVGKLSVVGIVSGSAALQGASVAVDGNVTAASGTFGGDLSVAGNLQVNGALTYVNTQNLQVTDKKVVIANGASGNDLDGAGIYLGVDTNVDESLRWSTADGGKWIASDKFAAETLQATDLSSAIVWADAAGNLVEISPSQFAGYLSAGFGISSVVTGTIVATEYTPGTGMHKAGFEFSIGQPVETTSVVRFGAVTGSNLTASRLMASDANKVMVSTNLIDWMTGSANKIDVKAEADGKVSFDLALQLTSAGNTSLSGSYASVAAAINDLHSKAGAASKKATYTVGNSGVAKDANIASSFSPNFIGELTADDSLVFVNGQLMDGVGDYTCNGGQLSFKFALEQGDLVTVKKG